jgi:hypothetical protein
MALDSFILDYRMKFYQLGNNIMSYEVMIVYGGRVIYFEEMALAYLILLL